MRSNGRGMWSTNAGSSWSTRSRLWESTGCQFVCTRRSMLTYASLSSPSDSPAMTVGIAYVDGPRLARAVYAAADWVAAGRDEINRINLFSGPHGGTGP